MAATLTSLPIELLCNVVDQLRETEIDEKVEDPEDYAYYIECMSQRFQRRCLVRDVLKNLRLTCRDTNAKTTACFGKECFESVEVGTEIGSCKTVGVILTHEIFRTSIRELKIVFPHNCFLDDKFVLEGFFAHVLDCIVRQAKNITRLHLDGPSHYCNVRALENDWTLFPWPRIVRDALAVVSRHDVHLKQLKFSYGSYGLPLSVSLLRPIDGSYQFVNQLTILHVGNFTSKEETSVSALRDLLANTPRLRELLFSGNNSTDSGDIIAHSIPSLTSLHALKHLMLLHMTIDGSTLLSLLSGCPKSIKQLELRYIALTCGAWKPVFEAIKYQLQLDRFWLANVNQMGQGVDLLPVNQHRPKVLIASHAIECGPTKDWWDDYWNERSTDKQEEAIENEEIVEGWMFVRIRSQSQRVEVELKEHEGDHIDDWLALIIDEHTLIADEHSLVWQGRDKVMDNY